MNRSMLIVVVVCTIFASAVTAIAKISRLELKEAENRIKVCYNDAIEYKVTGNAENKTCKNINDFNKQFKIFADVNEQYNNFTYSGNHKYIGTWQFLLRHKNAKDYINNLSCMNQTSCVNEVYGVAVEDKKKTNTMELYIPPTDDNVISALFDPAEKPQYHVMMCDKIESLAKCLEVLEFSKCGNDTAKFYVDFYAYLLQDCRNHTKTVGGSASGLTPVTFLVSIIVTVMFLLR